MPGLVAVVQVPLAAIAFVMEVFGASYGPPAIVACVLTYMLAKRWRLYVEPTTAHSARMADGKPPSDERS